MKVRPCTVLDFGEVYNGNGQESSDLYMVSKDAFDNCDVNLIKQGEKVVDSDLNTNYIFEPDAVAQDYYFTSSLTTRVENPNNTSEQVDEPNCKLGQRLKVTVQRDGTSSSLWGFQTQATRNTRIAGTCADNDSLYQIINIGPQRGLKFTVRASSV